MNSKIYVVDVEFCVIHKGYEFYIMAQSINDAWEKVVKMQLDAETITIRETDMETVAEVLAM